MSDPSTLERRQAQRVQVAVTVELRSDSGFSLHATKDLSVGGAFFARSIPFPVGEQIHATLHLPGESPVSCRGEVVNVPEPKSFGMGLRFIDLSEADQQRLAEFMRESR